MNMENTSAESVAILMQARMWNIGGVAQFIGTSRRTIYNMINLHRLPAVKLGGQWRFDPNAVKNWITVRTINRPEQTS